MKKGTDDHPKTHDLCARLKIDIPHAIGILELLWAMTRDYAPAGDIGRYSDEAIARACYWRKAPRTLIEALVASHWIDESDTHRLVIHDWPEHAGDYVKRVLKRAGKTFAGGRNESACIQTNVGQKPDNDRPISGTFQPRVRAVPSLALPVPEPEPCIAGLHPDDADAFSDFFERLYSAHPNRRDRGIAQRYLAEVSGIEDHSVQELIAARHAEYCATDKWRQKNGAFAPTLAQWLLDEGYRYPPPKTGDVFDDILRDYSRNGGTAK